MRPVVVALLLAGCAAPETDALFNQIRLEVASNSEVATDAFVDLIGQAKDSLHVALPKGDDPALADALLDAWAQGIELEVLTDFDSAASDAIVRLIEADVPVRLADAGLSYFEFGLNDDVAWSSDETIMSNAYVVADRRTVVAATAVGGFELGTRILLHVTGEDIVTDLLSEHNQLFGGTDATAVNAFDSPSKSILDTRWRYATQNDVDFELWFGPQERLTKRIIDSVYGARASIKVLTGDFANEGLAAALQEKASWGFDVEVIVGPTFGTSTAAVSRIFEQQTPDVVKRRLLDAEVIPTIVLIDPDPAADDPQPNRRVLVLTHDLYSAARLYRGDTVLTDQLIDGMLWVFVDRSDPAGSALMDLRSVYEDHLSESVEF